jgi:hypothetical protein
MPGGTASNIVAYIARGDMVREWRRAGGGGGVPVQTQRAGCKQTTMKRNRPHTADAFFALATAAELAAKRQC